MTPDTSRHACIPKPAAPAIATVLAVGLATYFVEWLVLSTAANSWLHQFSVVGPAGGLDSIRVPATSAPAVLVLSASTACAAWRPSRRSAIGCAGLVAALAAYSFVWTGHAAGVARTGHEVSAGLLAPLPVAATRVELTGQTAAAFPAGQCRCLEVARDRGLVFVYDPATGVTVDAPRGDVRPATAGPP